MDHFNSVSERRVSVSDDRPVLLTDPEILSQLPDEHFAHSEPSSDSRLGFAGGSECGNDLRVLLWGDATMSAKVFGSAAKFKVIDVGTIGLLAKMVNVHSRRRFAVELDPHLTMDKNGAVPNSVLLRLEAPVSEFVDGSLPNLTRGDEPSVLTLKGGGDQLHMVTAKRLRSFRQYAVTATAETQRERCVPEFNRSSEGTVSQDELVGLADDSSSPSIRVGCQGDFPATSTLAQRERATPRPPVQTSAVTLQEVKRFSLDVSKSLVMAVGDLRLLAASALAKSTRIAHWVASHSEVALSGRGAETPWPHYTGLVGVHNG